MPLVPIIMIAGFAYVFFMQKKKPAPPNPNLKPLPGQRVIPQFAELERKDTMRFPVGDVWLLEADVPLLLESVVTEEKIREALEELNLTPLSVRKDRPEWWPVLSDADWYVLVTNTGETRNVELPGPVERVWMATPPKVVSSEH